jgi:hypothetical protein
MQCRVVLSSEYGPSYDRCLPWITENCPEILLKGCDLDEEVS